MFKVLLLLPRIVIKPREAVVVLSSNESRNAVILVEPTSRLSINSCVTDPMVALLYLTTPVPGSASVVVVENESLIPPLSPVMP